MGVERKNVERFLQVGGVMIFHADPNRKDGPRFKTVLRGWRKQAHLMVDRPRAAHGGFAAVQENQSCVIRFLYEGQACAFDSKVIDWDTRRHNPYLRLTWPREVQFVSFRKFERVRVQFPCRVALDSSTAIAGEVRDLSMGGCGIVVAVPSNGPEDTGAFQAGQTVSINCDLPEVGNLGEVKALVRNCRGAGDGVFLGCEFSPDQDKVENDIAYFVTSTMERQRTEAPEQQAAQRVLVFEADTEVASRMRYSFEQQGVEVISAATTIDGFHRLRASPPAAVVVSAEMADLPGIQICGLIKGTRGTETLPLYLYGGGDPGLEFAAQELQLSGYFPPSLSMVPDIAFDVSHDLAKVHSG